MKQTFITDLQIKNVRHLKDIHIPLSKEKRKHLILTGKNGSGKTSVLNEIKSFFFNGLEQGQFQHIDSWKRSLDQWKSNCDDINKQLEDKSLDSNKKSQLENNLLNVNSQIEHINKNLDKYSHIELSFNSSMNELLVQYKQSKFLLSFFEASRISKMDILPFAYIYIVPFHSLHLFSGKQLPTSKVKRLYSL